MRKQNTTGKQNSQRKTQEYKQQLLHLQIIT